MVLCCAVFSADRAVAQSGACCNESSCVVMSDGPACIANGREFFVGEDCDPNPCAPSGMGACCIEGLGCTIDTAAGCSNFGGIFLGVNSPCAEDACLAGGCCHPDGTCDFVFEPTCNQQGGIFLSGESCAEAGCGPGACCTGALCTIRTLHMCQFNGGDFFGEGTDCAADPCGAPVIGGCCVADFCSVESQSNCAAQGGAFLGSGSTCEGNPCGVGSCCQTGFACFQAIEEDCTSQGGEFIPDGQACESDCGFGACCLESGCSDIPAFDCLVTGNLFIPNQLCEADPCSPCLTCEADMNGDQRLDGSDVQGFADCVLATGGGLPGPACRCADMDHDFLLTAADVDSFLTALLTSEDGLCP